jgi:putative nucleotidyltransferase with HDIG domain
MSLAAPAPGETVDWAALAAEHAWLRRLAACPQDPEHHGEGDVLTHTRLVCDALAGSPAWRALPADDREATWLAALLHDVAKPDTTRVEADGRLHARGHSTRGAVQARGILWRLGVAPALRERVASIVRSHQAPFFVIERDDAERRAIALSVGVRCDLLALVAEADARGRIAADVPAILERIELFRALCDELGCLRSPFPFASDHARFRFFHADGDPRHAPWEAFRGELTVMSGLPGAGKDAWLARHAPGLPVVSLDDLRDELGVDPEDAQGEVVQAAREAAREHLRSGWSFAWSATNLSRALRGQVIRLAADYGARVRVVHVEAPPEVLARQNRERARVVPERVVARLVQRWEMPDETEAHQVVRVGFDAPARR